MDRAAGVRELKARLSHYLDVAREEGPVIITERGKPVARLTAIGELGPTSLSGVLEALAAGGALQRADEPTKRRQPQPVAISGRMSASKIVSQMRR